MRRPFRKVLSCRHHVLVSIFQLTVLQIDFSKELISWVKREGFSLLDANLFPKSINTVCLFPNPKSLFTTFLQRGKLMEDAGRDVLIYLWDNYVQKVQHLQLKSLHDVFFADFQVHSELSLLAMVLAANRLLI